MDQYFQVEVVAKTPAPQQLIWLSMHQCVCEGAAIADPYPIENKAGDLVVKHLLAGNRGHYSPLEAPQISFNVIGFNHRTMQQITRHRIGIHFSVQSLRYTSDRFCKLAEKLRVGSVSDKFDYSELESLMYFRPVGQYSDRQGKKYDYTESERLNDLAFAAHAIQHYAQKIGMGYSEEQAAGTLPMDVRQHWVMSCNARSLMHLLDLRWKADAQLEAQQLCDLLWAHFNDWMPEVAEWYKSNRAHKARLAP